MPAPTRTATESRKVEYALRLSNARGVVLPSRRTGASRSRPPLPARRLDYGFAEGSAQADGLEFRLEDLDGLEGRVGIGDLHLDEHNVVGVEEEGRVGDGLGRSSQLGRRRRCSGCQRRNLGLPG